MPGFATHYLFGVDAYRNLTSTRIRNNLKQNHSAYALGLQGQLKSAGYDAQVAFNPQNSMYRVVATTFDDKGSAVQSRNQLRAGKYPDAWLLYKK